MTEQAITKEELRDQFVSSAKHLADYWSRVEGRTDKEKCEGVVHSMLVMIDGMSGAFPCSIDLVMRPHPDDKQYNIDNGDDYIEDGMVINDDVMLHEELYK